MIRPTLAAGQEQIADIFYVYTILLGTDGDLYRRRFRIKNIKFEQCILARAITYIVDSEKAQSVRRGNAADPIRTIHQEYRRDGIIQKTVCQCIFIKSI